MFGRRLCGNTCIVQAYIIIRYEPQKPCTHPLFKTPDVVVFLVVFSFFEKTTYCCRARRLSVRPSVCLSVCPSVCPSVEIISFRGNSLSNRPIELKIGLNVREGVVHVR